MGISTSHVIGISPCLSKTFFAIRDDRRSKASSDMLIMFSFNELHDMRVGIAIRMAIVVEPRLGISVCRFVVRHRCADK